jgi:hypothetical protein
MAGNPEFYHGELQLSWQRNKGDATKRGKNTAKTVGKRGKRGEMVSMLVRRGEAFLGRYLCIITK